MTDETQAAYSLEQVGVILGVHPETVRRAIRAGELAAFKMHLHYRVSRLELAKWWRSRGGGELFADVTLPPAEPKKPRTKKAKAEEVKP